MRFESSSVKVIAKHPICPRASVKVKRIKVTGQWMSAACDWARRVPSPDVQSRIVLVKEFVCSLTELSELFYGHTSRCEAHFKTISNLSTLK